MRRACVLGLLCFTLCFDASGAGAPDEPYPPTPQSTLARGIPQKLQTIEPGQTTRAQVYKALGRPPRKQPKEARYALSSSYYDTTVTFDARNVVSEVLFVPRDTSVVKYAHFAVWGGDKPQRLLKLPRYGYELEFNDSGEHELSRVTLRAPKAE